MYFLIKKFKAAFELANKKEIVKLCARSLQ